MRRRDFLRDGARFAALSGAWAIAGNAGAQGEQAPAGQAAPKKPSTILIWSEGSAPPAVYPKDISGAIADGFTKIRGYTVKTATLSDPEQGVSEAALSEAAVLFWWGHVKHNQVTDETVARIKRHVEERGMGFVALHSSHFAKPFKTLVGDTGAWKEYRNDRKPHKITVANANHPIARGVPASFTIPQEERYEEPFVVPTPEAVVFDGVHESNGNRARQVMTWTRGKGRLVYFRPGHEEFPVYFMPEIRRMLRNAALWAANDEAAIWEDNDPAAPAARATKEPPLALIVRDAGYGGTPVTAIGEMMGGTFRKAERGDVKLTVLAAYGVLKNCRGGWYKASGPADKAPESALLYTIEEKYNKQMNPPLKGGSKTAFDPKNEAFGLWVSTEGFPGETIYSEDARQVLIPRFKGKHKAHIYPAIRTNGSAVLNAVIIGFEYSTNDDNQEVVLLVQNVRPA